MASPTVSDFQETLYLAQGFDLDRINRIKNSGLEILLILSKNLVTGTNFAGNHLRPLPTVESGDSGVSHVPDTI